jgi:hypothetical protein
VISVLGYSPVSKEETSRMTRQWWKRNLERSTIPQIRRSTFSSCPPVTVLVFKLRHKGKNTSDLPNCGTPPSAVTIRTDPKFASPGFQFAFAKNREPLTKSDLDRARILSKIIKGNVPKPSNQSLVAIGSYLAEESTHIPLYYSKQILKFGPPIVTPLIRMVESDDSHSWQYQISHRNESDQAIYSLAKKLDLKPLAVQVITVLTMPINVSHTSQSSVTDEKLATLSKYSNLVRHCTSF